MHNGKFDYKVIKCTCGNDLKVHWDTYIAARLLDENEPSAGLKQQYIDKIDPDQEKYSIDHLFENVEYAWVDPEIFALYAATDSMMTYKLYLWQKEKFSDPDLARVYNLFMNVEMPIMHVVARMELRGISLDQEYAKRLSEHTHKLIEDCNKRVADELENLKPQIEAWKLTPEAVTKTVSKTGKVASKSKIEQLDNPISVGSPTQLAILLYDILKAPVIDKEKPRGTGVDELKAISDKTNWPICKLILEKRELDKLLNTFVDKLPNDVNPSDGKIHCEFLQVGTDTGRFSSKSPNLQQLPRDNKTVRMLFCAQPGYMLVGSDFSAQEVRIAAFASQDMDMINAYKEGKDLYSVVATAMFNNKYEDNLEFYPEGTEIMFEGKPTICGNKTHMNKEGKLRRQSAKAVLIGSIYGRGAASIADQINSGRKPENRITKEDAQAIIDNFYKGFPRITKWMEECHELVHTKGFVETWNGRRRRLPDAMLPKYTIKMKQSELDANFNPFLGCENRVNVELIEKYNTQLNKLKSKKEYDNIKTAALKEGIEIHDNTGYISQAERQSVNFPCQAGGAEVTKLAMINIDKDPTLKELGFSLLLTIHDEVIGECPKETAEQAANRLVEIMVGTAVENNINVPMKCDPTVTNHWYEDEMIAVLNNEFNKLNEKYNDEVKAYQELVNNHSELLENDIDAVIHHGRELLFSV